MSSTVCIMVITSIFITGQPGTVYKQKKLVVDESICRVAKQLSGKKIDLGDDIIENNVTCRCALPDKNAVMIPTFVGKSKSVCRR